MKIQLDHDTFKQLCISMAEVIKLYNPSEIVAVVRGGLSAAHIIAKYLKLPIGVYFPKDGQLVKTTNKNKFVVVEDLVAHGRTFNKLCSDLLDCCYECEWMFAPVLVDSSCFTTLDFKGKLITTGMITSHWIVMPYEEYDMMVEGDRGLFRNGDDKYGK